MPSLPTTPLPTPAPAPRRPPVPAGVLRAIAVFSVIGLAYLLSKGSDMSELGGETPAITFDASFPSPLIRAAAPLADGLEIPTETAHAAVSGIVTTADSTRGILVLLHKTAEGAGKRRYLETRYQDARELFVAVGDPVARGQKLAGAASREIAIFMLDADAGEKAEISIEEFLRNHPSLASPRYAIPPFPAHGGGETPTILQPHPTSKPPLNLESP